MERVTDIGYDAADPALVGRFWAAALRGTLELFDDGVHAKVKVPGLPTLWVDAVPESTCT